MPLPYRRMFQVPDALITYLSDLFGAGFHMDGDAVILRNKAMDATSRLLPGEDVEFLLANTHFDDENARATLTIRMNNNSQIDWSLEWPS